MREGKRREGKETKKEMIKEPFLVCQRGKGGND